MAVAQPYRMVLFDIGHQYSEAALAHNSSYFGAARFSWPKLGTVSAGLTRGSANRATRYRLNFWLLLRNSRSTDPPDGSRRNWLPSFAHSQEFRRPNALRQQ